MKVTVTKNLNIRSGSPTITDTNNPGYYTPGTVIDTDGVVTGQNIEGNGAWHKIKDSTNYVWSGGTNNVLKTYQDKKNEFLSDPFNAPYFNASDPTNENLWKVSWGHIDLEIWKIWKNCTYGEGIKVAVIDTGAIYSTNDLKGSIDANSSYNFTSEIPTDLTDTDSSTHGTLSCGVVGANGNNVHTVFGVAPKSEIIVYRLFSNSGLTDYNDRNFFNLLKAAQTSGANIISISFTLPTIPQNVQDEIQNCINKNILVIAAVGDSAQTPLTPQNTINLYPASCPNCISVGAYKLTNNLRAVYSGFSAQSDRLKCLAPGDRILSTGATASPAYHEYTSAATPFVAGIFALILSNMKKNNINISALDLINKIQSQNGCNRINPGTWDIFEGYGVINPLSFFNQ